MAGFFSRLFGGGSKRNKAELFIEDKMQTLINKAGLKLSFDLKVSEDQKRILIDLFGEDEEIAKDKDAQLLDAFQLFLKRSVQKEFPDERLSLIVDCDSYREQSDDDLIKIAEELKAQVISKKKPAFFRALPPRERKIIHQYLSEDKRFKTKSVGDGMFKKIKILLASDKSNSPSNGKGSHESRKDGGSKTKNRPRNNNNRPPRQAQDPKSNSDHQANELSLEDASSEVSSSDV